MKSITSLRPNLCTHIFCIVLIAGFSVSRVEAAVIHVPGNVPRIQQAIAAAQYGDTIVVAEGVYNEFLQFLGKNITITGTNPDDWGVVSRTIIQPLTGFAGPVVEFGGESPACLLTGLTIQKGMDGGIRGNDTRATISRCWVRENTASSAVGGIRTVAGLIDRCRVTGNTGASVGGIGSCSGIISNCLIADNHGITNEGALRNCSGPIVHCTIVNNSNDGMNMPAVSQGTSSITNCIIWGNTTRNVNGERIVLDLIADPFPRHSCYSNATQVNGNIKTDPQLGPGYSLTAGSPCIDAGTNNPPIPLGAWDLRGGNRVVDGDDAASVVTDMGAIEFDPLGIFLETGQDRLDFGGAGGVAGIPMKTFEIYNLDGYSGDWELDPGSTSWLTVEPISGTLSQTAQTITIRVDATGLTEGEYTCDLGVVVDGVTKRIVPVVLHVGSVIRVPQDVTQIQAAIVQANDWDTIVVSLGTYKENLDFLGKKIYLRSADPQDWNTVITTIIDGRCQGPCVTFNKGEGHDSIIEGLTLQLGGGSNVSYGSLNGMMGGGILCLNSSPMIRRCNVSWNGYSSYPAPGQWPPSGNAKVYYGGGIALIGVCHSRIEDCLLLRNTSQLRGMAIYSAGDEQAGSEIERCTISDNFPVQYGLTSTYDIDCTSTATWVRSTIVQNSINQRSILTSDPDRVRFCFFREVYQYTGSYGSVVMKDIACQNGNIVGDPRFVMPFSSSTPTVYDYRLKADSPCINHGDPGFLGDGLKDLDGQSRVMDGRLDMGAFEFLPEIKVIHPMAGDVWAAGSRHTIAWTEYRDKVVIVNPGFEWPFTGWGTGVVVTTLDSDVPGWTVGPNSGVAYTPEKFDFMPTSQSKFTGFDRGSGVYQLLIDSYRPNCIYTLKLYVGCKKDVNPIASWQAALTAGDRDTIITAVTQADLGTPGLGKWIPVSLVMETGSEGLDANVGKRIGILLTGDPRVDFDEVSLAVEEITPSATVDVELSMDNGQKWQTVADDVPDTGSYSWTIPSDTTGEMCRIRAMSSQPDFLSVPGGMFSILPYQEGEPVESRWPTEGHDMQRTGLADDNGPELGCVKWQYSTLTPISGNSVLGADEKIVMASEGGDLDCLDADGQLIWKYSTRSPEEQLEGCWMLNDGSGITAADCLGARNGDLVNFDPSGTQWVEDATFGTVLEFDGVDDYVRIPGYKGISGSQPRVCSAWIQTTQANTDIMMWGSNGASGTRWRIRLQERDGVGVLKAEINGGNILGCTPVNTGEWVHIRVVLPAGKTNSQDILLFVNGVREPSESVSIIPFEIRTASDMDVHIGASLYAGSYFLGRMRDVRISTVRGGDGLGLGNLSIGPDGSVYVGDGSGVLHAVDSDGQLRWKHQTTGMIAGAPAVGADGKVIFGSVDGTVIALGADGSELWTFAVPGPGQVGGAVMASPAIGRDGKVYVGGLYNDTLYALDPVDGHVVWTCDFDGGTANQHPAMANAPAVGADGTIYATLINDPKLYAIDPDDGSIAWALNLAGSAGGYYSTDYPQRYPEVYPWASPAVGPDGTIYVAFDDPYLRAVNPDGTIRWVTRLGMVGGFSVSVGADGKIYAAGDDRSLYVLNPEGMIVSRFDGSNWLSWPVIGVDETLYVSDFAGTLWAIAPQPCDDKTQRLARPADITLDGIIRLEDLAEMAREWKECTDALTGSPCVLTGSGWKRIAAKTYLTGDIDRDSYVGLSDLAAMADTWLAE